MKPTLDGIFADPKRKVITAHRGLSGRHPENTLSAFLAAIESGADIVEFDVRDTQDEVPVILHDDSLDRTTNGAGLLRESPWKVVRTLEASYWSGTHDAGRRLPAPAEPGVRIPSLEEVFETLGGRTCMNIQVYVSSEAILRRICDMVRQFDLYSSIFLMVQDFATAACVRGADREIQLCIGVDRDQPGRHFEAGARYLQPWRGILTPAFRDEVARLGLRTSVFFANTPEDMAAIWDMGFQGILTDCCDVAVQVRKERFKVGF
ncbi:MAG: glycerophosphodiester phosphodiesterase family protein [Verrucomicrobiae bacterium]|nr:glycerophosphodiester phosphodiesterase family protein [Verrucomicrobiae bacterium]